MERREALGAAGGLRGESPGAAPKGVPEGVRTEEADAGPPSGVVPSQGSGPSPHSVEIVTCAPGSSRPTAGVAVLGSGPHRPPGEVASLSAGVCGTCSPGSGGSGVYSWECSPSRSGSTCRREVSSPFLVSLPYSRKKAQRWDEMNILATYHPADKDYGFMKVDEPSTPYQRLQDSDEDMPGVVSHTVTPQELAERFATMDNFYPKVLRYRNKRSSESSDIFSKTHSSDFDKHRKSHYDEGKFLKAQKSLPFSKNKPCHGARSSLGSGSRVMEPRPVERGRMGGLTGEVQDEICLVTRNHVPEVKG
uniref:Protein phosphatase inhibitor 2 n=1 Tax=Neovison vison TaxID=452646 RepID=A0A8C7A6A1_NEOVI